MLYYKIYYYLMAYVRGMMHEDLKNLKILPLIIIIKKYQT